MDMRQQLVDLHRHERIKWALQQVVMNARRDPIYDYDRAAREIVDLIGQYEAK